MVLSIIRSDAYKLDKVIKEHLGRTYKIRSELFKPKYNVLRIRCEIYYHRKDLDIARHVLESYSSVDSMDIRQRWYDDLFKPISHCYNNRDLIMSYIHSIYLLSLRNPKLYINKHIINFFKRSPYRMIWKKLDSLLKLRQKSIIFLSLGDYKNGLSGLKLVSDSINDLIKDEVMTFLLFYQDACSMKKKLSFLVNYKKTVHKTFGIIFGLLYLSEGIKQICYTVLNNMTMNICFLNYRIDFLKGVIHLKIEKREIIIKEINLLLKSLIDYKKDEIMLLLKKIIKRKVSSKGKKSSPLLRNIYLLSLKMNRIDNIRGYHSICYDLCRIIIDLDRYKGPFSRKIVYERLEKLFMKKEKLMIQIILFR